MTFLLGISWVLAFPWSGQCRIGETLDQCKARYGNPVEENGDQALFFKGFMYISVHLARGNVDEISYYKKDPKHPKKSICPSDAEVGVLLRANAPDAPWELEVRHRRDAFWINKEKGLSAFCSRYHSASASPTLQLTGPTMNGRRLAKALRVSEFNPGLSRMQP